MKVIEAPAKPDVPEHIGIALRSSFRSDWLESIFAAYDKMHNTSTLSHPFLRINLPSNALILAPKLSFEVLTTDMDYFYELKVRLCANGPKMLEGIHFDESYSPACDGASFCLTICIMAILHMIVSFIDAGNAFQTNLIDDPSK